MTKKGCHTGGGNHEKNDDDDYDYTLLPWVSAEAAEFSDLDPVIKL